MIHLPKPGAGYSLQKTAASTNDSYKNYERSVANDEVWQALTTEAGRQALGA